MPNTPPSSHWTLQHLLPTVIIWRLHEISGQIIFSLTLCSLVCHPPLSPLTQNYFIVPL